MHENTRGTAGRENTAVPGGMLCGLSQRMLCAAGPFGLSAEYSGTAEKGLTAILKEHSCAKIRAGASAHAQRHGVSSLGASAGARDVRRHPMIIRWGQRTLTGCKSAAAASTSWAAAKATWGKPHCRAGWRLSAGLQAGTPNMAWVLVCRRKSQAQDSTGPRRRRRRSRRWGPEAPAP